MEIATMHDMSKETFLRPDQLKRGAEIELTQRPEWGTAFIRGRVRGKPQLWEISKSMDKRGRFVDEDELLQHWRTPNMSNTRKEIAARLGFAAKAKMAVRQSGDDDDETIGMSSTKADIISFYDSHPDLTLAQLSRMTGRDVQELKRMLMSKNARPGAKAGFAKWEVTPTKKNGVPIEEHTAKIGIDLWKIDTMPHAGVGVGSLYRWDKLRGLRLVSTGQVDLLKKQAEAISTKKDAISDLMRGFSRPGAKTRMTREQTEEQKAGLKVMSAADPAIGAKIATLIKEGKPQDQAVAIALDMKRRGEL